MSLNNVFAIQRYLGVIAFNVGAVVYIEVSHDTDVCRLAGLEIRHEDCCRVLEIVG